MSEGSGKMALAMCSVAQSVSPKHREAQCLHTVLRQTHLMLAILPETSMLGRSYTVAKVQRMHAFSSTRLTSGGLDRAAPPNAARG